jgi:iron-sulfur cluster repair protein YtfE (RIC family)
MFQNLIDQLTQSDAKNTHKILSILAQKILHAKNEYTEYQQQLDNLSLKLLKLSRQKTATPEQLNQLIKKYQELIYLILTNLAGSSSEGAGAKLKMPIINHKNLQPNLDKITEEINQLLEEKIPAQQNSYQSFGELVVNIIIGIFSFFMSDLEELDEQTKKELNQELTNYKQQQKDDNIITQINLILNQLRAAPKPIPTKSTKQKERHFFPSPFTLTPILGGGSTKERK